ncbi:FUSC family protein [Pseudomonas putida]
MDRLESAAGQSLRVRCRAVLARIDLFTPRSYYVCRSLLAAATALVLAFALQLETPYSAASTVLLVINPVQGAVIGKGTWRVLGTLLGMLVALLLLALFGQMPWLFMLGLSVWLGVCVAGMTLLRHFRASGTVVAGYTIGLATYGAMQHPQLGFEHVLGRGSTVVVGVVALGVVSSLFSRRTVHARLAAQYRTLLSRAARVLAQPGSEAERLALLADTYAVDDLLALGKAESVELAQRAAALRHGMAALFAALSEAGRLPADAPAALVQALRQPLDQAYAGCAELLSAGDQAGVEQALQRLWDVRPQLWMDAVDPREHAALARTAQRLGAQLDAFCLALQGLLELGRPRPRVAAPPVRFHRDYRAALRNGARSMIAMLLAGAFWIATGWDQGDMMLLVVAPYCSLLATAGNPAAGAWAFVKGTLYALPAAFTCAFLVLPHLDGMPLLLVALALFWLPGVVATSVPRTGLAGLAYLVAFNTLTAASNPLLLEPTLFLNQALAWLLATLFTWMSFRLLLPPQAAADLAHLRRRLAREALQVLRNQGRMAYGWGHRQQHRIAQVAVQLKGDPARQAVAVAQGAAALQLGQDLARIRQLAQQRRTPYWVARQARQGLRRLARRSAWPALAARHGQRCARALASHPHGQVLAAVFEDVAQLLSAHAEFFQSTTGESVNAH